MTPPVPGSGHDAAVRLSPVVPAADLRFEAALAELEQIVQTLENGQPDLEAAIAAWQRGQALLRHCEQQLADAGQQLRVFEQGSLSPAAPTFPLAGQETRP